VCGLVCVLEVGLGGFKVLVSGVRFVVGMQCSWEVLWIGAVKRSVAGDVVGHCRVVWLILIVARRVRASVDDS